MEKAFLDVTPKRYLCPYCGKWHKWNGDCIKLYSSWYYSETLYCQEKSYAGKYSIHVSDDYLHYSTDAICRRAMQKMEGKVSISSIQESSEYPRVTFDVDFTATDEVGNDSCSGCNYRYCCNFCKLGHQGNGKDMKITFGFEFEQSDYDHIIKSAKLARREKELQEREQNIVSKEQAFQQTQVKEYEEVNSMEKTTFLKQIYEHSPKENVEMVKEWAEKYKATLKWAIPVVSIYGAYRILNAKNSALTVENIESECNKKLGFSIDCLKDKKALGELILFGGLVSGSYTAMKAIATMRSKNMEEISVEDLEEDLDGLEEARKKFGFIQSKTEKLLPIAVSVIIVYLMTQEPAWFETLKGKISRCASSFSSGISLYWGLVKLFVADKLHVNLEEEEEVKKFKKFTCLAAIVGIGVFLYGTKILNKKEEEDGENEKLKALISQIISIMEKLMPTAFAGISTFLITKKVLKKEDTIIGEWAEEDEEEEIDGEEDDDEKKL